MNGDNGRSVVAEDVAAITALKIAEDFFVDDISDFAAGYRSGCTTEQATEDGTSKTTEQHAGRTTDGTYGCASVCTGHSTSGTGCSTTDGTCRAANPSSSVQTMDVGRTADGTFGTHGFSPGNEKSPYLCRYGLSKGWKLGFEGQGGLVFSCYICNLTGFRCRMD